MHFFTFHFSNVTPFYFFSYNLSFLLPVKNNLLTFAKIYY